MKLHHLAFSVSAIGALAIGALACDGGGGGGTGGSAGAQGGSAGHGGAPGTGGGTAGHGGDIGQGGVGGVVAEGGGGGAPSNLQWYSTCGDPVCQGASDDPQVPDCTGQVEGQSCSPQGQLCEITGDGCNVNLVCSDTDPKTQPGGCPISKASAKHDISYLTDSERDRIKEEVLAMPLATWKYNTEAAGEKEHLGFIIDDQPPWSAAIRPSGERVDLYGYTSMAVAALQAQQREIEALRAEIRSLRAEVSGPGVCAPPVDPAR